MFVAFIMLERFNFVDRIIMILKNIHCDHDGDCTSNYIGLIDNLKVSNNFFGNFWRLHALSIMYQHRQDRGESPMKRLKMLADAQKYAEKAL